MSIQTSRFLLILANLLTISRLLSTPFVVLFLLKARTDDYYNTVTLVLLVTLQATDILDGFLARLAKNRAPLANRFGEVLDPLADKLYIGAAYLTLAVTARIDAWVAAIIVLRDLLIVLGWLYRYLRSRIRSSPNVPGKVADTCQAFLLFAILLSPPQSILRIGIYTTLLLTVVSGVVYALRVSEDQPRRQHHVVR